MDAKTVGNTIASLRKKAGFTQAALAQKLNVSDKTVSKWESGQGFPEITQFPLLSKIFGVSVDYLMKGEASGIAFCGNILADIVKTVERYPQEGMLSYISSVSKAVGGSVPNCGIDLAKIDRSIPVYAIGKVGDDEYGRFVLSRMQNQNIDVSFVKTDRAAPTGFSDIMSSASGERTIFYASGANARFSPEDVDLQSLNCSILHAAYILLLDTFDMQDNKYGTVMARFLHDVRERGIKTSIDVVSNNSADYAKMVKPALKYATYAIMNEIEICSTFGLESRKGDMPHIENIRLAMQNAAQCGVEEKVIVHCKEMGFCLDVKSGKITENKSLKIPSELIKGSVGAGDAFCTGCLYGIYNGFDDKTMLKFAAGAAACSLFAENSVDGMCTKKEIEEIIKKYEV
ncbi:MAG: helix-turn-helix domain-containing protein [Oscillospiraceae bacterium]|nr:helix-turn-helix domain-containing protein [Candidatus Equicaccousia limihippi]